jgi:hypothetical protein
MYVNNIMYAAEHRDDIMSSQGIDCPSCRSHQYAPFDKLFVSAYGRCVVCIGVSDDELDRLGENIMSIIRS